MLVEILLNWALFPSSANASSLGYEEGRRFTSSFSHRNPYSHSLYTFLPKLSLLQLGGVERPLMDFRVKCVALLGTPLSAMCEACESHVLRYANVAFCFCLTTTMVSFRVSIKPNKITIINAIRYDRSQGERDSTKLGDLCFTRACLR
jgi:hypothetical protein